MSDLTGDAVRVNIQGSQRLAPHEQIAKLVRLGLLNKEAEDALLSAARLTTFAWILHPLKCSRPPEMKRWDGNSHPFQRVGNIFLWEVRGKKTDGTLAPSDTPDAVWVEYYFAN
ncbi:MAG: hypothetical protein JWM56_874 [Candidatus Peribacteria bacterium]|nr:hypothetical protein [Candidatus Peribacteria bacterium]